jgi:hypothetical protein
MKINPKDVLIKQFFFAGTIRVAFKGAEMQGSVYYGLLA